MYQKKIYNLRYVFFPTYEREDAKAEGKAEGIAETLIILLSALGEIPEELQKKIMSEKDENVLLSYFQKASRSTAIDEFLSMIE